MNFESKTDVETVRDFEIDKSLTCNKTAINTGVYEWKLEN